MMVVTFGFVRDYNRRQIYGITGAEYIRIYPLSFNRRVELTLVPLTG